MKNLNKVASIECNKFQTSDFSLAMVIPTLGTSGRLNSLLTSLSEMIKKNRKKTIKIHVIFNGCSPSIVETEYIFAHTVSQKNVNRARNYGIRKSDSTHLLFLDDDVEIPDEKFLDNVFTLIQNHPNDLMGGHYITPNYSTALDKAYLVLAHEWILSGEFESNNWHLLGGSLIVPKSVFDFALFDETISFGGSESEFLFRIKNRSIKMRWQRQMAVIHHPDMTIRKLHYKAKMQARTMARFFSHHRVVPLQNLMILDSTCSAQERTALNSFLKFYRDTFEFYFNKTTIGSDDTFTYI